MSLRIPGAYLVASKPYARTDDRLRRESHARNGRLASEARRDRRERLDANGEQREP